MLKSRINVLCNIVYVFDDSTSKHPMLQIHYHEICLYHPVHYKK